MSRRRIALAASAFALALASLAGTVHAQAESAAPQPPEPEQPRAETASDDAPLDEQATEIFARMDSDRDGQLSLEEFERGVARPFGSQGQGVVYQKLPARFRALDTDGSGFLEAGEYARIGQRWQAGGDPPDLSLADRNHDGRVDFREFAALHAPREQAPAATPAPGPTATR